MSFLLSPFTLNRRGGGRKRLKMSKDLNEILLSIPNSLTVDSQSPTGFGVRYSVSQKQWRAGYAIKKTNDSYQGTGDTPIEAVQSFIQKAKNGKRVDKTA